MTGLIILVPISGQGSACHLQLPRQMWSFRASSETETWKNRISLCVSQLGLLADENIRAVTLLLLLAMRLRFSR